MTEGAALLHHLHPYLFTLKSSSVRAGSRYAARSGTVRSRGGASMACTHEVHTGGEEDQDRQADKQAGISLTLYAWASCHSDKPMCTLATRRLSRSSESIEEASESSSSSCVPP